MDDARGTHEQVDLVCIASTHSTQGHILLKMSSAMSLESANAVVMLSDSIGL